MKRPWKRGCLASHAFTSGCSWAAQCPPIPLYGTERYNGLRLAGAFAKRDDTQVRVFPFGDAVGCALANQKLPDGYYHLDRMVAAGAGRSTSRR
ncbi:MAG: hypothetical protein ACYDAQ_12020 [Mycobacteriales bacterium]